MALSAFDDKTSPPKRAALMRVLGRAGVHWDALLAGVKNDYAPVTTEWGFAGAKWGWSLRVKQGKRNIVYLTPCDGHFLAGTALGKKAVQAALEGRAPARHKKAIEDAPQHTQQYRLYLLPVGKKDLAAALRLVAVKVAN